MPSPQVGLWRGHNPLTHISASPSVGDYCFSLQSNLTREGWGGVRNTCLFQPTSYQGQQHHLQPGAPAHPQFPRQSHSRELVINPSSRSGSQSSVCLLTKPTARHPDLRTLVLPHGQGGLMMGQDLHLSQSPLGF